MRNHAALAFDPKAFLSRIENGKSTQEYRSRQVVFSQGDAADAVFYVQSGKVKLTVVSTRGKEAVIGVLEQGSFFGEGCLAAQPLRMSTASAIQPSRIIRVARSTMVRLLHREPGFAELFGKESRPESVIPKVSQETLAGMVGTTRSRVSYFMNRFRKMGFIHDNGGLQVHSALLTVVLRD